jgi:hypothetical protein
VNQASAPEGEKHKVNEKGNSREDNKEETKHEVDHGETSKEGSGGLKMPPSCHPGIYQMVLFRQQIARVCE